MKETLTNTQIPETAAEPEASELAASWLQRLAARGVTVTVRNNRLWLHPASAHRALGDDEVLTLRHHRQAIKDAIKNGVSLDVVRAAPSAEKPTPAPEPPCKWCNRAPCIGEQHAAYYALHPEAAQQREDERLTAEMLGRPMSAEIRDPYAHLTPEVRERERKAAEVRRRLGWDEGTIRDPFR